jgi:hypothetical protein
MVVPPSGQEKDSEPLSVEYDSRLRWVKICMRVEFHQRKNGLFACLARCMKSSALAVTSSSIVSMRCWARAGSPSKSMHAAIEPARCFMYFLRGMRGLS